MLKKVGLVLLAVVAIFLVVVALQPAAFRVERRASIDAPASVVFPMIDDFKEWDSWSPWAKLDPAMKKTWSGPAQGVGAVYEWEGDKDGKGRMEITNARENADVIIALHFLSPFEASNVAEFTLTPKGNGVDVVWAMTGKNGFMAKAFGLVMNMDKLVGGDFEKGLAELKRLAETKAAVAH